MTQQLNGVASDYCPPTAVPLTLDEIREGLRLERARALAHDLMHVAENDLTRYIEQVGAINGVPSGWQLRDWMIGFTPPEGG